MDVLDWIMVNRPGAVSDLGDRIEIEHRNGEHSTLWYRQGGLVPQPLFALGDMYVKYDGMDLFSSTFKIASLTERKVRGGVDLTFTLQDVRQDAATYGWTCSNQATPFMLQQGIGLYALSLKELDLIEFDTELLQVTDRFATVFDVWDEWLAAVS